MDNKNNNPQPLISIIVPYYNTEKYLRRCVESLVSQTYHNIEILLLNDGSEDSSFSIAEEFADKDPRVVSLSVPHGGVSATRNTGLREANGKYIMFVDGDDWMGYSIIEHMMDLMLETKADLVTCDITRAIDVDETLGTQEISHTICTRDEYMQIFFKINSNEWVHFPVAKLYKKELLPNPLYPVDIRVGEDVLGTYLAISQTKTVARLKEVGYYYFFNPHGATGYFDERDFDLIPVWDQVVDAAKGKEPDYSYARLNRKRINFTLLLRLVTEVPSKERKEKYSVQQKKLLKDLRACEKELLDAPIVRSRKLLIFMLCHFFPVVSFMGNVYVRLGRLSGSEIAAAQRRPLS